MERQDLPLPKYKGLWPVDMLWKRDRLLLHCRMMIVEGRGYTSTYDEELELIKKEFEEIGMGIGYTEHQA